MMENFLTTLSFTVGAITALICMLYGSHSYESWIREMQFEKEKVDRLRFGINQDDVTVNVIGSVAKKYYQKKYADYSHQHLRNRVADLIGATLRYGFIAIWILSSICFLAACYMTFSSDFNGRLLVWAIPVFIVTSNIALLVLGKLCNFITGCCPEEPLSVRMGSEAALKKIEVD